MAVARGRERYNKISSMNTIYIPRDEKLLLFTAVGRLKTLAARCCSHFAYVSSTYYIFYCISLPLRNLLLKF